MKLHDNTFPYGIIPLLLLSSALIASPIDMPPMVPKLSPVNTAISVAKPIKKEPVNLAINGLEVMDFIKMISSIMGKNILVSQPVRGKIDFVSSKQLYKEDLYDLLVDILENYGFTVIDTGAGYLNVTRAADVSGMNLPVMKKGEIPQMVTDIVKIKNASVDVIMPKIRHLLSKNAKVIVSKESNSLIISDYGSNLKTLQTVLEQIDVRDETTTQFTRVIPLKNTEAKTLVTTLNNVISKKILKPNEPRSSVTSDDVTNSLVITATDDDFKELNTTITILDEEREQVYVKAKIVEISEGKSSQLGLKYGVAGGISSSRGLFTLGSALNGGAAIAPEVSGIMSYIKTPTSLTSGLALGASLSFLQNNDAADTLSEPSILCINNQESTIYVGKTESVKTGTTFSSTGSSQDNYTRQDIGLTLKIKPRVSNDNKVSLTVETKLEDIESISSVGMPTTTKREVKTNAIVSDGESVIIGGLIKDKVMNKADKVPLLGDIPLLGALFRYNNDEKDKTNLVIILTPYIVSKSADLASLRKRLAELDEIQEAYIKRLEERNPDMKKKKMEKSQ